MHCLWLFLMQILHPIHKVNIKNYLLPDFLVLVETGRGDPEGDEAVVVSGEEEGLALEGVDLHYVGGVGVGRVGSVGAASLQLVGLDLPLIHAHDQVLQVRGFLRLAPEFSFV